MQPAQGLFFIHEAIQREVADLEASAVAAKNAADAAQLPEKLQFFGRVLKAHTDAEAGSMFADLEAKVPAVRDGYLHDHDEEQKLAAQAVAVAQTAAKQWSDEAHYSLCTTVARLRGHVDSHISKENEVIVPLVMRLFTPAEQGAQAARMIGLIPPPDLQKIVPWLIQRLTPARRVDYVKMMQVSSPPERFAAFVQWVKGGITADAWQGLTQAMPQLVT